MFERRNMWELMIMLALASTILPEQYAGSNAKRPDKPMEVTNPRIEGTAIDCRDGHIYGVIYLKEPFYGSLYVEDRPLDPNCRVVGDGSHDIGLGFKIDKCGTTTKNINGKPQYENHFFLQFHPKLLGPNDQLFHVRCSPHHLQMISGPRPKPRQYAAPAATVSPEQVMHEIETRVSGCNEETQECVQWRDFELKVEAKRGPKMLMHSKPAKKVAKVVVPKAQKTPEKPSKDEKISKETPKQEKIVKETPKHVKAVKEIPKAEKMTMGQQHDVQENMPHGVSVAKGEKKVNSNRLFSMVVFKEGTEEPKVVPPTQTAKVGEYMTMMIKVKQFPGVDSEVFNCSAHDGNTTYQHPLIDMQGCAVFPSIMPNFETRYDVETNHKIYYNNFPAFKFKNRDTVQLLCSVRFCQGICKEPDCASKHRWNVTISPEVLDKLVLHSSDTSLHGNEHEKSDKESQNGENEDENEPTTCMSFVNFYILVIFVVGVILISVVIAVCLFATTDRSRGWIGIPYGRVPERN